MKYLKKYWWVLILLVVIIVVWFSMSDSNSINAPAGVSNKQAWLDAYREELARAKPFNEDEMANRNKYGWNEAQHMHNKAVWITNQRMGTNVNANNWRWPTA